MPSYFLVDNFDGLACAFAFTLDTPSAWRSLSLLFVHLFNKVFAELINIHPETHLSQPLQAVPVGFPTPVSKVHLLFSISGNMRAGKMPLFPLGLLL